MGLVSVPTTRHHQNEARTAQHTGFQLRKAAVKVHAKHVRTGAARCTRELDQAVEAMAPHKQVIEQRRVRDEVRKRRVWRRQRLRGRRRLDPAQYALDYGARNIRVENGRALACLAAPCVQDTDVLGGFALELD